MLVLAVSALVAMTARAQADEPAVALLLDTPARTEIGRALLIALAERDARVLAGDTPMGDTPLQRAAVAQRMARALGASTAVWAELGARGAELYAVTIDGGEVHRAPLPGAIEVLEPRIVATVAASLVEELWVEDGAPAAAAPAQMTVVIRIEPEEREPASERRQPDQVARAEAATGAATPATGAMVVSSAEAAEASEASEASGWLLAGGGAFQSGGLASVELRLDWRGASGRRVGAWSTFGHAFADESWTASAFGIELSGTRGIDRPTLEYGLFAGFHLVSSHEEPARNMYWTSGLGALLAGARIGLGVPVSRDWSLRVDVSAALAAVPYGKSALWSWVSLLAERRL